MPTWDAQQYLQFADQRTRPCRELVERIQIDSPKHVIDLGCGPGNSTAVIAQRWPGADITGLDSSEEMISKARQDSPDHHWVVGDITEWAKKSGEVFDLVLSNAAMQWVDDHAQTYPRLMSHVAPGGALAIQVPGNHDAPAHVAMREIAESPSWQSHFPTDGVRSIWRVRDMQFYYDALSPQASRLDLWTTEYIQVMPSAESIVEWYKGSGLRPYLDALATQELRTAYLSEYLQLIRKDYPRRPDGKVLFPFLRLFIVAYR